ncbi:hypothetical protein CSKR_107551 [Clonorchis sinensis]|uniref:Uncharacterized protein n=1 Tax=Clonorchis sinensis TaxID=79923 RepID=A0A3R7CY27_CLOSI|nr:hypothetical protein CSKR_107551 [Clonorchis sinensis]
MLEHTLLRSNIDGPPMDIRYVDKISISLGSEQCARDITTRFNCIHPGIFVTSKHENENVVHCFDVDFSRIIGGILQQLVHRKAKCTGHGFATLSRLRHPIQKQSHRAQGIRSRNSLKDELSINANRQCGNDHPNKFSSEHIFRVEPREKNSWHLMGVAFAFAVHRMGKLGSGKTMVVKPERYGCVTQPMSVLRRNLLVDCVALIAYLTIGST